VLARGHYSGVARGSRGSSHSPNLPYLSKLLEKIASSQFENYIDENHLRDPMQSAYRRGYSVETALTRVQNDILLSIDDRRVVMMALLDLSAAFDTVHHDMLLKRLHSRYGVCGSALLWFQSYLQDRYQCVRLRGVQGAPVKLECGVPQGSVLGPMLFSLFTAPIGDIIRSSGLNYHLYADDTQVYVSCQPSKYIDTLLMLESCLESLCNWMLSNRLKLNHEKTKFIVFRGKKATAPSADMNLHIGQTYVPPSQSVRNLGVIFDTHLTMVPQIKEMCSSAMMYVRYLGKIRSYISDDAAKTVAHALITSRIDNCNSLLTGLPDSTLKPIQRVLNTTARVVSRSPKFAHITPLLKD